MNIQEGWNELCKLMDKDGMLPPHPCKVCGEMLNADGGHPAELYLGGYTGMCYKCQNAARYVAKEYPDSAVMWSYPPSCPSWRRDRETFTAYSDCLNCRGDGQHPAYSNGGSYRSYCKTCSDRFYVAPTRQYYYNRCKAITEAAKAVYEQTVIKAFGKKKWKKATREQTEPYRLAALARYDRVHAKFLAQFDKRYLGWF